jgi:hypothetical protein
MDGNPLYWSRDRNPFQLATQDTYAISENLTEEKNIGCVIINKLCKRRSQQSECPEHPGKYITVTMVTNLKLQDPIGRKTRPQRKSTGSFYKLKIAGPNREEDQATKEICRQFLQT